MSDARPRGHATDFSHQNAGIALAGSTYMDCIRKDDKDKRQVAQ